MRNYLLFILLTGAVTLCSFGQTRLTNNPVTIIGNNSAVCAGPSPDFFLITENSFYQFYDLQDYPGITDTAFIVRMLVACQETNGGAYSVVGKVHSITGGFSVANLTFIADDTAAIPYPDSLKYVMTIPFEDGYVLPGDSVASEIHLPVNPAVSFFPGSNGYPQTGLTYLTAPGCAINDFTPVGDLGFPGMHLIMHLYVNQKPAMTGMSAMVFKDEELLYTSADFTAQFTDNDTDGLTMVQIFTLPANGSLEVNSVPVAVGDTITTAELDLLKYIPAAGYAGPDSFTLRAADSSHWSNSITTCDITVADWQVSVKENQAVKPLIYPNPFNSVFTIQTAEALHSVRVFDAQGKLVFSDFSGEREISLSHLTAGSYVVEVRMSSAVAYERVIRQ